MSSTSPSFLIFVSNDYEDLELWYPRLRLQAAGVNVTVAGPKAGETYRGKHGYPCKADAAIADVQWTAFGGLLLVGGWAPDALRRDERVLHATREMARAGRVVAAICHGPWMAISAGVCRGIRMTSTPGIKDDLLNAGATWVDEPVVIDRNFITSRRPSDLPAFGEAIIRHLNAAG